VTVNEAGPEYPLMLVSTSVTELLPPFWAETVDGTTVNPKLLT
jgi:hypothetical protein